MPGPVCLASDRMAYMNDRNTSEQSAPLLNTELQQDMRKVELQKAKTEMWKQRAKVAGEIVKNVSVAVALVLSAIANFTKASTSDVEKANNKTKASISVVAGDIEKQHEQTEKIRETVEGTTAAVKTIADSSPLPAAGLTILDKEPDEKGCWTVYGGIVRCKGLDGTAGVDPRSRRPTVSTAVPDAPPPMPPPASIGF